MDGFAMILGYSMMVIASVIAACCAAYYAINLGNILHWKIVDHIGGYKALMQFKEWRDKQSAESGKGEK
jgi:hypothetical protein